MIKKNKDESYNKFQLTIIILIAIISIFITGLLIIQNIDLPTINFNQPQSTQSNINKTNNDTLPLERNTTSLIDPTLNKTYVPMGVNTTYYTHDGGEGKTYSINNTIAYVIVAGGGGGSYNSYTNTNMTYVGGGGGAGSYVNISYEKTSDVNSAQLSNITPNMTYVNYETPKPIETQSLNTSQNITPSIIDIINIFPNVTWIFLIFIFGIIFVSSNNSSTIIPFSIILIMILWWLNIIQINNMLIFILPVLFIYIYIKMLFPRR
jgi:hypothetical protein